MTAIEAAQVAIRVCEEEHYWVTPTIVDMDGVIQLVMRGDHARVHTGESSFRKTFPVVALVPAFEFGRSSGLFELVKTNPFAPQLATVRNVMALPGAVAFKANGEMVGALCDRWRTERRQRRFALPDRPPR